MVRQVQVEYAGAIYHIINRDDRQEAIFHDEQDRLGFLATVAWLAHRLPICKRIHRTNLLDWHHREQQASQ